MTLEELLDRAELGAPTADDLRALDAGDRDLLDAIDALDGRHADATGPWSALTLYEDDRCEVALFAVSAGDAIPLHDHPGMTVHQRVLRGAVAVESWDLLPEDGGEGWPARRLPAVVCDAGSGVVTLSPTRGNLHRVRAREDAVFVDVLAPPYGEGRRCSEWRVAEEPGGDGVGRLAWVRTL